MKVLHVPDSVGGNPSGLSRALRNLGLESESWALIPSPFGYPCDRVIWLPTDGRIKRELKRWLSIAQAARSADVIHFNFGTSLASPIALRWKTRKGMGKKLAHAFNAVYMDLLQLAELNIYRLLKIPMFVHYQGDDARQGDFSSSKFTINTASQVETGYYEPASDRFKRRMIRRMAKYCDCIFSLNPDLLHVLPEGSRFVPYCHISLEEWPPLYPDPQGTAPLRIGHAPSHRGFKGTHLVIAAVEALKAEGHPVELVLIEGIPHREAKVKYESIDILIDQLFAGWYGGVAVELMALGKPVLVYIRQEDLAFIPQSMQADLPFVEVEPKTILEVLRGIVQMPRSDLHALGRRSRAFVERWHDPRRVAIEMRENYEAALRRRSKLRR